MASIQPAKESASDDSCTNLRQTCVHHMTMHTATASKLIDATAENDNGSIMLEGMQINGESTAIKQEV